MDADVVVIGAAAGLAGLAAARHLQQQGWSVLVLEATDRVGGRVRDAALPDGGAVELGAQWVGRDHAAVHALADELGLRLVAVEEVGQHLHVDADGQVQRYTGHLPPLPECARADLGAAAALLHAGAPDLADDTAAGWLVRHVPHPDARWVFDHKVRLELCAEPGQVAAAELVRFAAGEMPHGGMKQSGFGKDMSSYSFDEYTVVKHVMYDRTGVAAKAWHRTVFTTPGAPRQAPEGQQGIAVPTTTTASRRLPAR